MTVLYATTADLRLSVQGTDGGVGTPAELTDEQLTLALQSASNRVSVYFGSIMDSSSMAATPPDIFHDLTLDMAVFFAWRTYLKGKAMPADHPAYLAYQNALNILQDARNGKIRLDPAAAGGVNSEAGTVINRIPSIFTGNDSNTRVGISGDLEPDTPIGGPWTPLGDSLNGGTVYQG